MAGCLLWLAGALAGWQLDPHAKEELLSAIANMDQFCVQFEQVTFSDFFDDTLASGRLCVSRPGQLRMEYTIGEKRTIICDGEIYYERDHLAETESRLTLDEIADEPLIRVFLFGDRIDDYFLIDRFMEESQQAYRFRPRDSTELTFTVVFDDAWLPKTLRVQSPDGEGTLFSFNAFRDQTTFEKGFFSLPEGVTP